MNNLHLSGHQFILPFFTTIVTAWDKGICAMGELESHIPNRLQKSDNLKPKNKFGILKWDEEQSREAKVISNIEAMNKKRYASLQDGTFIGYEKANGFLDNCKTDFVDKILKTQTGDKSKLDAILETLSLGTTKDWEDLAESTNLKHSLKTKKSRDNLIVCADTCEEKHEKSEKLDGWIKSEEKNEEKSEEKSEKQGGKMTFALMFGALPSRGKSKKEQFGCHQCLKYLPATMLKWVPDKQWFPEQNSKIIETKLQPTTTVTATVVTNPDKSEETTKITIENSTTQAPTATKKPKQNDKRKDIKEEKQQEIACGYRNRYMTNHDNGRVGQNLFDPSNPKRFLDSNIVFGNVSHLAEFPWQVSIRSLQKKRNKFICGGTLIDSKTVITSGDCGRSMTHFHKRNQTEFEVAVGFGSTSFEINDDAKFGAGFYKVRNVLLSSDKNMAVIKLQQQIVYPDDADTELTSDRVKNKKISGTFVRPICLSENNSTMKPNDLTPFTMDQQMAIEVDYLWFTAYDMNPGKTDTNLKLTKAYIGKMNWSDCEKKLKIEKKKEEKSTFCAMSLPSEIIKVDTCKGDSGGGLYWAVNPSMHKLRNTEGGMDDDNWENQIKAMADSDRSFLIGVSTWDKATCDSTTPTVYAKVENYLEWIRKNSFFPQSAMVAIKHTRIFLLTDEEKQVLKTKTNADFQEWNAKRLAYHNR